MRTILTMHLRRPLAPASAIAAACLFFSAIALPASARQSIAVEIQSAETLIAEGQYVQALATSRSAAQKAPSDHRARYYAAMSLLGLERFSEARTEADLALSLAPQEDRTSIESLIAAIDLQSVSLTAEADAEAALAAGLNARAARLFAQAFEADPSRTEAGFQAAGLYAGTLKTPVDAARILRKIEDQSPDSADRARAAGELETLAPVIRPIVDDLVRKVRSAIDSKDAAGAGKILADAEALDSSSGSIAIQRARLAAIGDDARSLEMALLELASKNADMDEAVWVLPNLSQWLEQDWLTTLLQDYKGADYVKLLIDAVDKGMLPGSTFQDCSSCPAMVVLPSGNFVMGSPSTESGRSSDEGPQRTVIIGYRLAVGKFEVTWSEWEACISDGGCRGYTPDNLPGWGKGKHPIVRVGWIDAKSYVSWLSKKTGQPYRLLSEAEWEYAARASSSTPFHTGSTISTNLANYNGSYTYGAGATGVRRAMTMPVGSFPANGFGLHDMHGNVKEWVEDCRTESYENVPSDGSAWTMEGCADRVLRGGSYADEPKDLRSANRDRTNSLSSDRRFYIGFRVAKTL
ncbi:MAG: hypothetical protein C0421_00815 [Hyphomonas sp.]|uniref:SUMF1/EgtB/PvdO family nonheme iron enzyme n=1 Tax=Hyphomonas sp. TaxID=87 RepID=UPI0025BD0BFD|nr:SUMF1/EgtB/PvdO family nonheme iron enzyme [Hyphomonas sp.]MBA4337370.1 hypothetical protein [Hyphomonas sp.]